MKQMAAFLVLTALFVLLVGSRFQPSDGDKLAAVGRLAAGKLRDSLPSADRVAGPLNALRTGLPEPLDGRVKARLTADKALEGVDFGVTSAGQTVTLRGVVATPDARRRAVELAESTTGVGSVVDELAVPE